jgi:hypothetical protein
MHLKKETQFIHPRTLLEFISHASDNLVSIFYILKGNVITLFKY